MGEAASFRSLLIELFGRLTNGVVCRGAGRRMRWGMLAGLLAGALLVANAGKLQAQTDCLGCHDNADMQDASGHSVAVDGKTFNKSIHGTMKCNDCHSNIKEYPHPAQVAKVDGMVTSALDATAQLAATEAFDGNNTFNTTLENR